MALKNRPVHPMQAAASAFFSVALVAGLMPVLPAAAYAEEQAQPAAGVTAVQEVQTPSLLDEGDTTTAPAAQSLLASLTFTGSGFGGGFDVEYPTSVDASTAVPTYTVTASSSCSNMYVTATLAQGVEGAITASYTDPWGDANLVTIPSGSAKKLEYVIDSSDYPAVGNSFDIKVGDQVAAHVVIVRTLALKTFVVQDASGNALALDPAFKAPSEYTAPAYEYATSVFAGDSITIKPTSQVSSATVTVNGEALGYLVLTSADEVICAYGFYYRAMIGLKEDGSFSFSSSAAESGVATFYKDENRDAQYNVLAESKLDENGNVVYFVNGEAADEDAFTAVINAQNEKADVTFVTATAENLALYLTIE